jgi:hypothetical protein
MDKRKFIFILILCICTSAFGEAPPLEQWAARYNGPGNETDNAVALAIDNARNIYVTGYSTGSGTNYDYATIKCSPDGNQLWVERYNGPGNDVDLVRDIATDSSGNVYVTGLSVGSGTDRDFATIKYDTNGNQLWVTRYNGPENNLDEPYALAIDNSGNVYVTGWTYYADTSSDTVTIKYDTNGNQLWMERYNGPGDDYFDKGNDVGVDNSGNVYVTGLSSGYLDDFYGYVTIKYDANGNQLWVERYNCGGWPWKLVIDNSGNIYVTGHSWDNGINWDYTTVKYDPNGNQLWVADYDGPADSNDGAIDIAIDNLGNVYVTGFSTGIDTNHDYATIKYDTNGNQMWVARYNGPGNGSDTASAVVTDSSGNVYVTGESVGSGTDYDYATIKYDTSGNQLWVARYNGPGNGSDAAYAVVADSLGNVYVAGQGVVANEDYITIKYTQQNYFAGKYKIVWSTIDNGGGTSIGGQYMMMGTIGQPDAGYLEGGNYELLGGFWPGGPLCFVDFEDFARFAELWLYEGEGLPADLDGNTSVDLYDLKLFTDEWLCPCPYAWPLK